jgi:hypothetical protein
VSANPLQERPSRVLALIDHRNVPWDSVSLAQLVEVLAVRFLSLRPLGLADVEMRAYGGWFEGTTASTERYSASAKYQAELPSLIRTGTSFVRVTFSFADHLLTMAPDGVSIPIQGTVVTRASAQTTVPIANATFVCGNDGCEIKRVRRWISRKVACVKPGCNRLFTDYWIRTEQKQVDIHLACDLIAARGLQGLTAAVVVSDDLDFVPILAMAALLPGPVRIGSLRFTGLPTYLDPLLATLDVEIRNHS